MKVAIASGKGGTGKTTISTNLALYLSDLRPTVLVDLDVEEPNSGLFLQGETLHRSTMKKLIPNWVKDDCNVCGNCQEVCQFNAVLKMVSNILVFPELCHSCHACSELCPTGSLPMRPQKMGDLKHQKMGQLDFVESRLLIGQEQSVPLIKQTIDYVDEHFPESTLKIMDSPPGTSCPVVEVIRSADLILLVTEPTPFGLHDLKLAVDTTRELDRDFAVVVNRHGLGDSGVEKYCEEEGIEIVARIPNSRSIAETYARGDLLFRENPEVAAALLQIADYIHLNFSEVGA